MTTLFQNIDGFLYKLEYEGIQTLIEHYFKKQNTPLKVLEIGAWKGKSTVMFLQTNSLLTITSIEPFYGLPEQEAGSWQNISTKDEFLKNTEPYKDRLTLIGKASNDSSLHVDLQNKQFDIFFIDGNHSYANVVNDIKLALRYTKDDGLILLDDFWINADKQSRFNDIATAVHELLMYKYKFLCLHRSVIVFQKNTNFKTYEK